MIIIMQIMHLLIIMIIIIIIINNEDAGKFVHNDSHNNTNYDNNT